MKADSRLTLIGLVLALLLGNVTARGELPIARVNTLIASGHYAEAVEVLQTAHASANAADQARIDRMLSQLGAFSNERRAAVGGGASSVGGTGSSPIDPAPAPAMDDSGPPPPPLPTRPLPQAQADGRFWITHLGGYKESWHLIGGRDTHYSNQHSYFAQSAWPREEIFRRWQEGYIITSCSGHAGGWAVVFSKFRDERQLLQRYFGPDPFNEAMDAWIKERWKAGQHITSVAGFGNQWVLVATSGMGWGGQSIYTADSSGSQTTEKIRQWWRERQSQGYALTSLNGGFLNTEPPSTKGKSSFFLIATKGTGFGPQTMEVDVPYPANGTLNEDTPVVMVAGYGKNRLIVVRGDCPSPASRVIGQVHPDFPQASQIIWNHEKPVSATPVAPASPATSTTTTPARASSVPPAPIAVPATPAHEVVFHYTKTIVPPEEYWDANGGFFLNSRGYDGWTLIFKSDGDCSWVNVEKNKIVSDLYIETMEAAQGTSPSKANDVVEWRGVMRGTTFVPHAIIYRMRATDTQTNVEKTRLVVVALVGGAPRIIGSVGGAGEGEKSRAMADSLLVTGP